MYCLAPSEVKDHVIPYARGGDDDLHNLVPACDACNDSKGDRTPLEFAALRLNPGVWGPPGHPGGGRLGEEFEWLRQIYMVWVDRIEHTHIELLNPRRRAWFQNDLRSTHYNTRVSPTVRVRAAIYRGFFTQHVAAAEAAGWPADTRAPFRIFQPREWWAEISDQPSDWRTL
ncbi:HNH endonuclease [Streptomyces achromogenes]|uniref:HNH endonuclease n=1 Tax=Streptomyces achromogenes TaxID=67255 RepID=UPI0036FAD946